ncbi:MAG TPA: low-specificity L-threonine aldolase [Kofleriaceae bacterium]|nr:low-specificity L-threonine aldolase [Kofleriaceae bacterium]
MTSPAIDLRSDTVTRPSPAMRRAMAEAEVGDDVFGEDPTVNRLQEVVADLLGVEAALFVPTGTMANQIAINVQTHHGDEILVGRGAHNWLFETGAAAALSGVQPCLIGTDGRFTADDVRANFKADNHHYAPTRLVSVENTHNMGGGLVWDRQQTREVIAAARELDLSLHLDGARLWNAAAATGDPERELAADFDTVSVCLSKGLGAPVGSVLAGSAPLIRAAHRARKRFGGGMRQAGILAAAGLFAIEHHRERLVQDHENAKYMARALDGVAGLRVDLTGVQTNIVMIEVEPDAPSAPELEQRARERGLRLVALGPRRIRLVTHLDVDRADCERAVAVLGALASE